MNAADLVSTAWANLLRRKGRTILTSAGVVVGVSTLVLMVSLGIGLQRQFVSFFESEESLRTLMVNRVPADQKKRGGGFAFGMMGQGIPLTDKDLDEIRAIPGVESAGPDLNFFVQVSFEAFEGRQPHLVQGVQPAVEPVYAKRLKAGRMWTPGERACLLPSSLLDSKMKATPEDVLDKKVTFRGLMKKEGEEDDVLTCVGVYDSDSFGFRGGYLLMPLELGLDLRERKGGTMLGLPTKRGSYSGAEVRTADPRRVQEVAARLKNAGYGVLSAMEMIKQINVIFLVVEAFLACIGAIGLVVSLFGIANTMAMAVLERTREIGVLKALGARDRDVGRLFLMEAAAIGALGGGTGLALAWLLGKLLNVIARAAFDVPDRVSLFHVTWWLAAGSVAFAVLVAVVAGTLPARRAARLEPVAALRFE